MKSSPLQEELPLSSIAPHTLFPGRTSLRIAEVAMALHVDFKTVLGWIDSGDLLAINISNGSDRTHVRIPVSSYDAFLKKRKTV